MFRSLRVSLITASMGFVLGCNDGSQKNLEAVDKGSDLVTISAHKKHHNKTMSLESRIQDIYNMKSANGDTCFLSQKTNLLQLARDLDQFVLKSNSSSQIALQQSHDYNTGNADQSAVDQWITIEDGWDKVLKTYQRIRGQKSKTSWQKAS